MGSGCERAAAKLDDASSAAKLGFGHAAARLVLHRAGRRVAADGVSARAEGIVCNIFDESHKLFCSQSKNGAQSFVTASLYGRSSRLASKMLLTIEKNGAAAALARTREERCSSGLGQDA